MPEKRNSEDFLEEPQTLTKKRKVSTTTMSATTPISWGEGLGSWKTNIDEETERIDRQKAAFGGDTVARIKDLHCCIIGCQGVGVETAKNLILSNVGSVTLYDPTPPNVADRGTNFYLTPQHVKKSNNTTTIPLSRAQASVTELQSLNPFCKVSVLENTDDDQPINVTDPATWQKFSAVVVTTWHPQISEINAACRSNGVACIVAANHGVTSTLFSDFGNTFEITDEFGEPTQLLAVSNLEVLPRKPELLRIADYDNNTDTPVVIVTVAQADHGLDDGHMVVLDDLRGALAPWNGHKVAVRRVAFQSPTAAKLDTSDVAFTESLKQSTAAVVDNFQKQYEYYQHQHESNEETKDKKFPVRTITMFNRLALVLDPALLANNKSDTVPPPPALPKACQGDIMQLQALYEAGGLLQQVRPPVHKSHQSLEQTLLHTAVPQMLRGDDWEAGKGIEIHLCWQAALRYYQQYNRYPRIHHEQDAQDFFAIVETLDQERQAQAKENPDNTYCYAQSVNYGFPSGEARELDKDRVMLFAKLFQTELTGFCAFLGGAAAQEVLKKTGKFTPISQWIHHDELCLVNDQAPTNHAPLFQSRYDHQIAILGKDFQAKIANQSVFLVGCGALGCEYLKGLSLMGVATGKRGKIIVTDMDRIEVSNLSRQFLFRDSDVGNPKSVSGARVVKGWNPQMNIEALEKRVGTDSEDFKASIFICLGKASGHRLGRFL